MWSHDYTLSYLAKWNESHVKTFIGTFPETFFVTTPNQI